MSFCVRFSGLISKLRIPEKSYESPRIFNVETYIWSLFITKEIYGAPMKPSELFCFIRQKKLRGYYFSKRQAIKNPSGQMRSHTRMMQINPPDDWLKTGWTRDSQARTRLVDSLFCITCSLENIAFFVLMFFFLTADPALYFVGQ